MTEPDFLPADRVSGTDIAQLEGVLLSALGREGLPVEGVLVEVQQRTVALSNLPAVISKLTDEQRHRSIYISKFAAATVAGLFDASLNYLWDETISELRRRVTGYDLKYFYDVAEQSPDRRKRLHSEADLPRVSDADLVRAANEMGLISDVGRHHLDHILYMRNWASAAHPNQSTITGLQLIAWLETCIDEVINLPVSNVVAQIGRLLHNIKTTALGGETDARQVAAFFDDLPDEQAESLVAGLFGIYTDTDSSVQTRTNVRLLLPYLWPMVPNDTRDQLGVRYGRFVANHDQTEAELAREFLDAVGAIAHIPSGLRAAELDSLLDTLLRAHDGFDNFYNERAPALQIEELVGAPPDVPEAVTRRYVGTVIYTFLTNGHGVAQSADPIYRRLIEGFTTSQAKTALLTFNNNAIAGRLQLQLPQQQYTELLGMLRPKMVQQSWIELLDALAAHPSPSAMRKDTAIKRLVQSVTT